MMFAIEIFLGDLGDFRIIGLINIFPAIAKQCFGTTKTKRLKYGNPKGRNDQQNSQYRGD